MTAPVSVVITCYNLAPYIGAAIDSARVALDRVAGEIIVVDDCSTDDSRAIAAARGVRLVAAPRNGGVMRATLLGIDEARHDLIAFLDGDDLWHPAKLERVGAAFAADPALGFVTHDLDFIDSTGAPIERTSRPSETMEADPAAWDDHLRRSILDHRDDVWLGSAITVHRARSRLDAFAAQMRARPDIGDLYQDWPMAAWVAAQPGMRLGYVPEKLFSYRLHGANHSGDSATLERARRNFTRARNSLAAMVRIADDHGVLSPKLRRDLALNEAQLALYEGRRADALGRFATALPQLARRPRALAGETVRLATLGLFGPSLGHRLLKGAARRLRRSA